MKIGIIVGGFAGLLFGGVTAWLSFGSAFSGVGIGITLAMAVCGALVAYGFEQTK